MIARPKEAYDGAIPSANSQAASNFIKLSRLTGDDKLFDKATQIFKVFNSTAINQPAAHVHMLSSVMLYESPSKEIVIVGRPESCDTKDMLHAVRQIYLPFSISIFNPIVKNTNGNKTRILFQGIENYPMRDNKATAYVCSNFTCKEPVNDIDSLNALLRI